MKKTLLFITVSAFACCCRAQAPLFLSPYKDGHTVPDSIKDYSVPTKVTVLSSSKNTVRLSHSNTLAGQQPANTSDEKSKPVVLSSAKKP